VEKVMMKSLWSRLSVAVLLSMSPALVLAQFETSAVVGTVRDKSGSAVPGAKVTLTNVGTTVSTASTTDATGNFEFFTVRIGTYVVTAEKPGFSVALADNVRVAIGARQRVDITLEVGQVSEKIEVTAAAARLETDTSQRGQTIQREALQALPLLNREYSSLALLTTGVRQSALSGSREGSFNVNGLRSTFNNFLIDGVDNNAYGTSNQGFSNQVMQPPPDAVDQFQVVTNNMSAEYGRSGGATVNASYRSGANALAGGIWEYFRDTSLTSAGYFVPATGKPPFERNQFGGVLGGPILRNRAFFFLDYEGLRQTRGSLVTSSIPTDTQRQGVLTVDVRNPLIGDLYPAGTTIPMTTFARKVLNELPATTEAGTTNNYRRLTESVTDTDKGGIKLDGTINARLSLFGRFGWRTYDVQDQSGLPLPSGGNSNGQTYSRSRQAAFGATYMPSVTSLLEIRFGWSRTQAGKNPLALGTPGALEAYGIPGLPTDARVAGGLPTQSINGYTAFGRQSTNPQWQWPTVYNPKLNYSWLRGRQSFKVGYEFQRIETQVQDVNPLYGADAYAGLFSRPTGVTSTSSLYNLADFMFGLRSQFGLSNILVANIRQQMQFLYLQDDIRVNRRLTVNMGLRYEYATPQWERDNILSNFDPATLTMVKATDGSVEDRSTIRPDRNNFGPRLGLAYTLTPRTVLRAGYGVSYVHFHRAGGGNLLPINGPQVINAVVVQGNPTLSTFRTTQEGYPADFTDPSKFNPLAANITYMPNDFRSASVQSWHVSAQRELTSRIILDVAYVGNKQNGALLFANYNQALPNNTAGSLTLQQRRPIQQFADITYAFNGGRSEYHAFQGKLDWRLQGGFSLLSSLTLSRARDNGAGSLENSNGNAPSPQNYYDLEADWGLSGYHQPYNNTTSFVWNVPFGRGRRYGGDTSTWLDALAGGWQIAGINSVYAGEPVTFTYTPATAAQVSGITQDFRGANIYRPNVVGDPLVPKSDRSITNYFNRDAVVIPTDITQPFGNAKRNSVRGPLFWQIDLALSKAVAFGGARRAEVRIEAFNLFDRANFRAPNGSRSAAGFGTITSTYDARSVQLGMKFNF
jgi:hypothetical protein